MRYLFVSPKLLNDNPVRIEGPDCHHLLNVLRIRVGEQLALLDGDGNACSAEVEAVEKRAVVARVCGPMAIAPEPRARITVAQALGKGDKFEQVVQHGTEAGATAFLPLLTERTVVRLDAKAGEEKRARWRLIAKGAAEQAHRGRIPAIEPAATLDTLTEQFDAYTHVLLLHPVGEPLRTVLTETPIEASDLSILLLIGPEGGFSPAELTAASQAGARIVTLGPFVLRTETAALVAVSQTLYHFDSAS